MKGTKSASRYAKALLDLAIENNKIEIILTDMKAIHAAFEETREFQLFLNSPIIDSAKKSMIIKELFPQFDAITSSFVSLVVQNRREGILPAIAAAFFTQLNAHLGIIPMTIVSATKLDDKTKAAIVAKIQGSVTGSLEVNEKIDAKILGGFIVKMGDTQIDASVSNQLRKLKQGLTH